MPSLSKNYLELIKELNESRNLNSHKLGFEKTIKIEDEIAKEKAIRNRGLEQDIELKKNTLIVLFAFLGFETIAVFLFAFFQAVHWPWKFQLEEWSFKLLVTVTISQITIMLLVAVRHLFPNQK